MNYKEDAEASIKSSKTEMICRICTQLLVTKADNLSEDLVALITSYAEDGHCRKNFSESPEVMKLSEVADEQPVASKCGHIFHMGCLRCQVAECAKGTQMSCPVCQKPVLMSRLWPILVCPTPRQAEKIRKMKTVKVQNAKLVSRLTEMRSKINELEVSLTEQHKKIAEIVLDIKGSDLRENSLPRELEELRKTYEDRRKCIKKITDHSSVLVDVLANELRRGVTNKGLDIPAPHSSISDFIESKRKLIHAIKLTEMTGDVAQLELNVDEDISRAKIDENTQDMIKESRETHDEEVSNN